MRSEHDSGARKRAILARSVDWMGVEERVNDLGIKSLHLKKFATEPDLLAWIGKKPSARTHRGCQLRLALEPPK